jgi:signal transduction histidine kinase
MAPAANPFKKAGAPQVWWSVLIIVLGFVLSNVIAIYEMRKSQAEIRLITRHAATNIELVAQLSRDLDRKRALIDDHILENDTDDMDRIEAQLAKVNADIAGAMRAYEPIDADADERSLSQELAAGVAAIEPEVVNAIAISRNNADAEAQTRIKAVEAQFEAIDHATNGLLSLNQALANHEAAQVRALQMSALILLAGLTIIWTAFALLTGRWVTRLIGDQERQTKQAMGLLEERNRELDAFAGRVAHDLRGPLTTINLAAAELPQPGNRIEAIGSILRRGVGQMEGMIQDLLTLSRISTQTVGATCQMADVAAFAQEDLASKVEDTGGALVVNMTDATVASNKGLLRQVLWNLGENAVNYRRPAVPLRLEIAGRITRDTYELFVSDNGSGMTPAVARQAFEPFFRGRDVQSAPGSGLGLSVVKRIIEASGGTVSIESETGRGTTFRIHLPLVASKAA